MFEDNVPMRFGIILFSSKPAATIEENDGEVPKYFDKELKIKQAQLAKAKAEIDINPNLIEVLERFPTKDPRPDVEWWVMILLPSSSYTGIIDGKLKIKMSNLMKVLGAEANLEMEIRSAAAKFEQTHVDRNIVCKLTPTECCEKKERKFFVDQD